MQEYLSTASFYLRIWFFNVEEIEIIKTPLKSVVLLHVR